MNKHIKILYIGANLHLSPINDFNNCNEFVFIDSSPRNEYGYEYYYKPFYKRKFYDNLIQKLNEMNFELKGKTKFTNDYEEILVDNLDSTCLTFVNDNKILKYYISTGIPNDLHNNKELQDDINSCSSLIISGHYPCDHILDYINKYHFIGYNHTYYPKKHKIINIIRYFFGYTELYDEDDNNIIIKNIINNDSSILSYTYVNYDNGSIIECTDYNDFLTKK
jgi:hypothetical protein